MPISKPRITLCLTVAALAIAGCGASTSVTHTDNKPTSAQAIRTPGQKIDVSVLRATHFDSDHKGSPEELVKARDHAVIAVGRVEGFEQGRDIYAMENDPYPEKRIVMHVKVEESIKNHGLVKDDRVYVDLDQGGVYHDGTPRTSLEDFRKAIPAGTKVMLFLFEDRRTAFRIDGERNGLPDGGRLTVPDPQGIIFETGNQLLGGQEDLDARWQRLDSIDAVAERVRKTVTED
ncbi:hypothetical protein [Planobispora longispora]|uniref:Lipoprotein n=1 Tax=Planobispora longispora TaxID=28887 RepID=A0A8J3W5S4_9ACTN|nr:hypothetical protein [Planobispora longispora]BFE80347.1 hypothetical protein GCM10020093_029480 [Planobispora longispora]GIH77117.1 hypothetical protein Plo01_35460 [Planobispora longispora]